MKNKFLSVYVLFTLLALSACSGSGSKFATISSTDPSPIAISSSTVPPALPSATPTLSDSLTPAPPTPTPLPTLLPQVTLEAVGDIMLGRTVGQQVLAKGPQVVFAGVQSALDPADVLVGNLECAITDRSLPVQKSFNLQAPPQTAQALSLAGFDVLSQANNHAMDYGPAGLTDTQKSLSEYGIATVGAGADAAAAHAPVIIQRNGLRMAFLAYVDVPPEKSGFDPHSWAASATGPGVAWADPEQIKTGVQAAKLQADVVIVFLHSGIEINEYFPPISANQRLDAHTAIDAGAALVIGSHPHVLEPIERYHGGLIAYSLGNFVFDQYFGTANATIILRVVLNRSGVQSYDYVPALIDNGLPHLITDKDVPAIGTLVAPPKK
jgi:poly-gamma-glutamate capsule biosynthesis protein CapA/YwtB (metallophosphatase superfamily)